MNKFKSKYNGLSIPLKATIWFTIANILLKGISFITVPILTRVLPQADYGIVSVYNSYQQLFLIFATFELYLGAFQRGILQYKDDIYGFTSDLILLCNTITVILFILIYPFQDWFVSLTKTSKLVYYLMFLYFLVYPGFNSWLNKKRFDYAYKPAVSATLITTLLISVGSIVITMFVGRTALIYISTILIIQIICYIPFYIKQTFPLALGEKNSVKKYWKYCLAFQLPLVAHSLSYLVLGQADRVMISWYCGDEKAAIYSVAYSLSSAIIIVQTSINQVFQPWRYKKLDTKDYKSIRKVTNEILVLTAGTILIFIVIAPEFMKLLFNKSYYEAVWTIPAISGSVFFMMLYTIFTDIESYYYKTNYIMIASLICAITNIVLNYFGIKLFGYIACGYTTLISYIFFAVLHYFFMQKVCKAADLKDELFDFKFILILSMVYLLLIGIILFAYNTVTIRYCILAVALIICFIQRMRIKQVITQLRNNEDK